MTFIKNASVALAAVATIVPAGQAIAQDLASVDINNLGQSESSSMDQVNSVFQLRDVAPSDWAFDALRNLVEKYNCIVGYPDGTFRGNRPLSRYEFAAGLNSCMQSIERLIVGGEGVDAADITRLRRLVEEFEAELATLGARVDDIEGRVEFLEDNQFSTTTKLVGEVAFVLADAFGDSTSAETVFHDKVRLTLVTSFTGKDKLYTRLTAGNSENSFVDEYGVGTQEGRFSYDGEAGNNITIDRLHYVFPLGSKTTVTTMASLGGHHFYADTFNSGLEAGGGASGALSRFGERNPIYRLGLGGSSAGIGFKHDFNSKFQLSAGYLAKRASTPTSGNGLFDGAYSALAQLVVKPSSKLKFGATYIRGYDFVTAATATTNRSSTFAFGGTGTGLANGLGVATGGVETDTFGLQGQFDLSPKFSLRAWGGYTDADFISNSSNAEIWTYGLAAVFPDLGKKGNMGAIIVGAEPYAGSIKLAGVNTVASNDTPFHIEGLYKYQLTDNISITPGVIWLTSPGQNSANSDIVIGAIRTTFKF
ncbi:MAG: iron uptake porin [Limnothrix sp. RL_2_0]|nr:iron uptake porin [Limnothrix sp. RL_2_0]